MEENFHTLRWYEDANKVSPAMEDYLEMIYRMSEKTCSVRLSSLAKNLNVGAPAASKMAQKIKDAGFIEYEPYSQITLTETGKKEGARLILRHKILNDFFCRVNHSASELDLVEKIEHFSTRQQSKI